MFSVVIPVYNHAQYIRGAVYSSLTSPLVSEVLLLDDGSRDASPEIIAQLAAANPGRVFDLTPTDRRNAGAHARLNELCRAARSKWIAVLNSDDEFLPGRFQNIQMLARRRRAEFVAGTLHLIDETGHTIGTKRGLLDLEYPIPAQGVYSGTASTLDVLRALCSQNFMASTSNMAFTRSLFERVGGFEDLRYSHDWAFALRCACMGRVTFTPIALTRYRLHRSNTIKEVSAHLDGEVTRFFFNILDEFPEIEADPYCRRALASNRHLKYTSSPHLVAARRVEGGSHALKTSPPEGALHDANALLATLAAGYDFAVVTESLGPLEDVAYSGDAPRIVFRDASAQACLQSGEASEHAARGRVVRAPLRPGADCKTVSLYSLRGLAHARLEGADVLIGNPPRAEPMYAPPSEAFPDADVRDQRPTVLVLPIFMAVGGVERNTIEIIRRLKDRFRFYVVTSERLRKSQGSLHYQLSDMEISVLDLAEAAEPDAHLTLLGGLHRYLQPDLVWICNGSPWLANNAVSLRRLFAETPVVDQQVYDVKEGWIQRYGEVGIQAFDHFIAVNEKIRQVFLEELRIPAERVSLIYSAINCDKLSRPLADADTRRSLKAALGVPDGPVFAFIGRLVEQKNPLEYLRLAAESFRNGRDASFILIGDGVLAGVCDDYIAEHGLRNVAILRNYEDPWPVMNAIDGLVITSFYEGLPIALLEALAFGVPAISTDVGDVGLVLERYGCGWVAPGATPGSIPWSSFAAWADQLPQLRVNALAAAPQVLVDFSSEALAQTYATLFDRLMAQTPVARGWGRRAHLLEAPVSHPGAHL